MRGLNKAQIIGRLGADPTTHSFENGGSVTSISVATSEKWTDKNTGELKELTEWHRITFFGKLAEIASQYLRKGSLVYIEGKLRTRKWTDKDNIERYTTEIQATSLEMLDSKPENGQGGQPQQNNNASYQRGNTQQPQQTAQQVPQAPQQNTQQPPQQPPVDEFSEDEIPY